MEVKIEGRVYKAWDESITDSIQQDTVAEYAFVVILVEWLKTDGRDKFIVYTICRK